VSINRRGIPIIFNNIYIHLIYKSNEHAGGSIDAGYMYRVEIHYMKYIYHRERQGADIQAKYADNRKLSNTDSTATEPA